MKGNATNKMLLRDKTKLVINSVHGRVPKQWVDLKILSKFADRNRERVKERERGSERENR